MKPILKKTTLLGLTGGIATGKSAASQIFRELHWPVICADKISHELFLKGTPLYKKIVREFGKEILAPNQEINRPALGHLVFSKPKLLKKLEALVHPLVKKVMMAEIKVLKTQGHAFIILDVPLLFEAKMDAFCDKVICIYATQEHQIERLIKRNGLKPFEARLRIKAQMPLKTKVERSDFVIKNTGSVSDFRIKIMNLIDKLQG